MKNLEPAPWPPKLPAGKAYTDEINGCTTGGGGVTSSWDGNGQAKTADTRPGKMPSR